MNERLRLLSPELYITWFGIKTPIQSVWLLGEKNVYAFNGARFNVMIQRGEAACFRLGNYVACVETETVPGHLYFSQHGEVFLNHSESGKEERRWFIELSMKTLLRRMQDRNVSYTRSCECLGLKLELFSK